MHSISANKTTTMALREKKKQNTLLNTCTALDVAMKHWNYFADSFEHQHRHDADVWRLMLSCCDSIFCRSTLGWRLRLRPIFLFSSAPLYNVSDFYRSLVGKQKLALLGRSLNTSAKNEVGKKAERVCLCSEIWFERVPARFEQFSSFRIFSPLCCCSRVRPVEFFNFLVYFTETKKKEKKRGEEEKSFRIFFVHSRKKPHNIKNSEGKKRNSSVVSRVKRNFYVTWKRKQKHKKRSFSEVFVRT